MTPDCAVTVDIGGSKLAAAVVVGGGVAASGTLLLEPLCRWFSEIAGLPFIRRVRIRRGALGADAGLRGAAALVLTPRSPSPSR